MIKLEIKLNIFIVNRLTKTPVCSNASNSNYNKSIEQILELGPKPDLSTKSFSERTAAAR